MSTSSSSKSFEAATVTDQRKGKRKRTIKRTNDSDTSGTDPDSNNELENVEDDSDHDAEPEPALSHAEKRRRKKEAKRAEKLKDGKAHPKKKRKLKDDASQIVVEATTTTTTTKRQNSTWVGNLSYKTQHEDLREFFKDVGEITRIHMPMKVRSGSGTKPENRGFAYVDFDTPEGKAAAVALSEQPLLGRKLLIKDGDDFEGRPVLTTLDAVLTDPSIVLKAHSKTAQKVLSTQKQPPGPTLFFGNLPFQTTDDEIRQLLDAHRPREKTKVKEGEDGEEAQKGDWIRKIRMGTFEDSGLCKGFAFVDFTSIDNATAALINTKNHHLNGRDLVVEYASLDAVRRGGSRIGGALPRKRRPLSAGYKKTRGRKKKVEGEDVGQERDNAPHVGKHSRKEKEKWSDKRAMGQKEQDKGSNSRPKPGAALAQAKRETAAIVPGQGKKIVF